MATPNVSASQIVVSVRLFADLRRFLPKGEDDPRRYLLPASASVQDLLNLLGIPAAEEITAGLNGDLTQPDSMLHDGDELVLFSPMEGG